MNRINRLAATLFATAALASPAYALDVQIQEGAAVKFPKGLKWEPMAKSVIYNGPTGPFEPKKSKKERERLDIAMGTAKPKDRERAIAFWNAQNLTADIASWETRTNDGSYFVSAAVIFYDNDNSQCEEINGDDPAFGSACKAKMLFTSSQESHQSTVDIGKICAHMGRTSFEISSEEEEYESFDTNRPEIAFDAKSNTFYLRQIRYGKVVKKCNRKIAIKH